jgi:hypothetical protein
MWLIETFDPPEVSSWSVFRGVGGKRPHNERTRQAPHLSTEFEHAVDGRHRSHEGEPADAPTRPAISAIPAIPFPPRFGSSDA